MEEELFMVMDDTNNLYDFDELPDVPPELTARARAKVEKTYADIHRKREQESLQSKEAIA